MNLRLVVKALFIFLDKIYEQNGLWNIAAALRNIVALSVGRKQVGLKVLKKLI